MTTGTEEAHVHVWSPGAVFREPGRFCECGRFEQISKYEFRALAGQSFWSWQKEYDDRYTFGGYMKAKKEWVI